MKDNKANFIPIDTIDSPAKNVALPPLCPATNRPCMCPNRGYLRLIRQKSLIGGELVKAEKGRANAEYVKAQSRERLLESDRRMEEMLGASAPEYFATDPHQQQIQAGMEMFAQMEADWAQISLENEEAVSKGKFKAAACNGRRLN